MTPSEIYPISNSMNTPDDHIIVWMSLRQVKCSCGLFWALEEEFGANEARDRLLDIHSVHKTYVLEQRKG